MFKLRLAFALTAILLVALTGSVVMSQNNSNGNYTEIQQEQLTQTEDGWLISFRIVNRESESKIYTVTCSINGSIYTEEITVPRGELYIYTHQVQSTQLKEKAVSFAVYLKGEKAPIEQVIYHLN